MGKQITFTAPQIKSFLYSLKRGNINDENNRRGIINIFLRAIYLFDDRFTMILNGGDRQITIDDILLDEIEEQFEATVSGHAACSPLVANAPPMKHPLQSEPPWVWTTKDVSLFSLVLCRVCVLLILDFKLDTKIKNA